AGARGAGVLLQEGRDQQGAGVLQGGGVAGGGRSGRGLRPGGGAGGLRAGRRGSGGESAQGHQGRPEEADRVHRRSSHVASSIGTAGTPTVRAGGGGVPGPSPRLPVARPPCRRWGGAYPGTATARRRGAGPLGGTWVTGRRCPPRCARRPWSSRRGPSRWRRAGPRRPARRCSGPRRGCRRRRFRSWRPGRGRWRRGGRTRRRGASLGSLPGGVGRVWAAWSGGRGRRLLDADALLAVDVDGGAAVRVDTAEREDV